MSMAASARPRRWQRHSVASVAVALSVLFAWPIGFRATQSEIDALMERVLRHRDENRLRRQDYVLDEREIFQLVWLAGTVELAAFGTGREPASF